LKGKRELSLSFSPQLRAKSDNLQLYNSEPETRNLGPLGLRGQRVVFLVILVAFLAMAGVLVHGLAFGALPG
jgi:hypothetical protein